MYKTASRNMQFRAGHSSRIPGQHDAQEVSVIIKLPRHIADSLDKKTIKQAIYDFLNRRG